MYAVFYFRVSPSHASSDLGYLLDVSISHTEKEPILLILLYTVRSLLSFYFGCVLLANKTSPSALMVTEKAHKQTGSGFFVTTFELVLQNHSKEGTSK